MFFCFLISFSWKAIEWDLQDLEDSVNVASKDPQRFGVNASEIADRR